MVHYFVRGGELLNFVGIRENTEWQVESWTAQGTTDECLQDFLGWHEDANARAPYRDAYKWALKVREPMKEWCAGASHCSAMPVIQLRLIRAGRLDGL